VVDAERHRGQRVQQTTQGTADEGRQQARPGAPVVRAERAEPRPEDHHAFEADVHHAGALGPQPAEAGQADRHRGLQRGPGGAAGGEVVGPGDDPRRGERDQAAGDQQQHDRQPGSRACGSGCRNRWRHRATA
jgi:hypothetical protein